MIRLKEAVLGTPHGRVRCQWCQSGLVVGEYEGLRCWVCPVDWARQIAHGIVVSVGKTRRAVHVPLPCQVPFYEATEKYLLWGGQAGPGKSTGARWYLYARSLTVPGHEALLLRENWDQLKANHTMKMAHEVPVLGGRWYETDRMAVFGKGSDQSVIYCGHMAEVNALERYIGMEYGAIVCDEASLYPVASDGATPLAELSTRARKVYTEVWGPGGAKGPATVEPRFLPVTNPGGPSAGFLLDFFIDKRPDFEHYPALRDEYDPAEWAYLPASLDDNPYLPDDYERSLAVVRGVRYEQLRHGDWRVFAGQFFAEWRESHHVRHLELRGDLEWFASLDWGFNAPGVCGWWACLPDGHYHLARELRFQYKSAEVVTREIQQLTRDLGVKRLRYVVADPSIWAKTGHGKGESIAETMIRKGLPMRRGDNDRKNGWQRVHELLADDPQGVPWLTVEPEPHCRYLRRSLPAQMSDPKEPDDLNTMGDDHAVDMLRYGAMSRPSPTRFVAPRRRPVETAGSLLRDLVAGQGVGVLGRDQVRR